MDPSAPHHAILWNESNNLGTHLFQVSHRFQAIANCSVALLFGQKGVVKIIVIRTEQKVARIGNLLSNLHGEFHTVAVNSRRKRSKGHPQHFAKLLADPSNSHEHRVGRV